MNSNRFLFLIIIGITLILSGCLSPTIKLFTNAQDPLIEFTLQGDGIDKILLIPVNGMISDIGSDDILRSKPSIVEEIVSQLKKAEKDDYIKAILLKVDSPGGTTTASDVLYNELIHFKNQKKIKIVSAMMGLATSGAYYISLPADHIIAHPTTVTGSVGVIFIRPNFSGLMDKLGLNISINKSGKNKDIGSPFRKNNQEEIEILQNLVDKLAKRFQYLVQKHRHMSKEILSKVSSACVYLPEEAKELKLIDSIGYLKDAIQKTKSIAKLDDKARVIVYRRTEFPEDNIYNSIITTYKNEPIKIMPIQLPKQLFIQPGFYYLWLGMNEM